MPLEERAHHTCRIPFFKDKIQGFQCIPSNSPKPIFRLAAENNLLPSAVERWLDYAEARTHTTHDYSGEKAKACLSLMGDFIRDATALYQSLSK